MLSLSPIRRYAPAIACPYCGRRIPATLWLDVGPIDADRRVPDGYACRSCPVLYAGIPDVLMQRLHIGQCKR